MKIQIRNLRWGVLALLFTATVLNYVDRQVLSIVAPVLTKELDISQIEYSNIVQAFLLAYTFMYIGSGILVDRWGTRVSLAVFIAWWSVANMLHGFARSALQLGIFRFLLGVGEPGNFMTAVRVTSEWYPPKEKALVLGFVNAAAAVGAIIAAPLVAWITLAHGWRFAFVATGALGFLWLPFWLLIYRLPHKHPWITPEELQYIREENLKKDQAVKQRIRWIELFRYRQTWGLLLAKFISDPVWWFYLFWLPKYLSEQRGFSIAQIGMLAWLPYLFSDLGSIAGGFASGYLIKRNWPVMKARAAVMLPFALVMPLSLVIAYTPSSAVALVIICLITGCHMGWKTNLMTLTNDVYPTRIVGSVAGIIAFGSGLGGTLFTNLTGHVVENFSYNAIFVIMGFLHPIAYIIFRLLVKGPLAEEQVPAPAATPEAEREKG